MSSVSSDKAELVSAGVVVPDHFLTQHTESLTQVRDYCQLALADILEDIGIELQQMNMDFTEWLARGDGLKPDIINYFAYEPDGYLVTNMKGVIKNARTYVVGLFSAVHLDERWLQREVTRSMILAPDATTVPVKIHDITRLCETEDAVHVRMREISEEALQKRIF